MYDEKERGAKSLISKIRMDASHSYWKPGAFPKSILSFKLGIGAPIKFGQNRRWELVATNKREEGKGWKKQEIRESERGLIKEI